MPRLLDGFITEFLHAEILPVFLPLKSGGPQGTTPAGLFPRKEERKHSAAGPHTFFDATTSTMLNADASTKTAKLTDLELLSLYLSLPPALRDEKFVDTAKAAEITGVSIRTIQMWIEKGAVRAIVIGRKYRIVLDSLRAHLETQMIKHLG